VILQKQKLLQWRRRAPFEATANSVISSIMEWLWRDWRNPGWPVWANFRLLGNFLLWAAFENDKSSRKFWLLFPTENGYAYAYGKVCIILTKMVWATFGQLFHKLIWSPWCDHVFKRKNARHLS
jgi:hypothetical protein